MLTNAEAIQRFQDAATAVRWCETLDAEERVQILTTVIEVIDAVGLDSPHLTDLTCESFRWNAPHRMFEPTPGTAIRLHPIHLRQSTSFAAHEAGRQLGVLSLPYALPSDAA
jgi:hypothetical protein